MTNTEPKSFADGGTIWIKPESWGSFGLSEAHMEYQAATQAARETFYNKVKSAFPNVPAGKALEVFPGKFGSIGVKLDSPSNGKAAKGPSISELAALFGPNKARK